MVEILVVLAIIATMVILPVISFAVVSKNARDTKRKQDVDNVTAALQQYRNEVGNYPDTTYEGLDDYLVPKFLNALPEDPRRGNAPSGYQYRIDSNGSSFALFTSLEKESGGNREVYTSTPKGNSIITGTPPVPTAYVTPGGSTFPSVTPQRTPTTTPPVAPGTASYLSSISPQGGTVQKGAVVANAGSGSYIIAGSVVDGVQKGYLAKVSSTGTLDWTKKINTFSDFNMVSPVTGGFVAVGKLGDDALITYFDSSGNISWSNTLSEGTTQVIFNAVKEVSGELVAVGYTSRGVNLTAMIIAKYSRDGNLLVKREVRHMANTQNFNPSDIIGTANGFAVVGTHRDPSDNFQGFFIDLPQDVSTVSKVMFYGGMGNEYLTGIVSDGTGYLVSGYTTSYGAGGNDGWLLGLSSDGSLGATRVIGGTEDDVFNSIVKVSEGIFLAGRSASYSDRNGTDYGNDGWVVKMSSITTGEWVRMLGGTENDGLTDIAYISGNLVNTGYYSQTVGDVRFLVSKMSADGSIPNCNNVFAPAFSGANQVGSSLDVTSSYRSFSYSTGTGSSTTLSEVSGGSIANSCN